MRITRREFGRAALAAIPGSVALAAPVAAEWRVQGQGPSPPNRSFIGGVQFGLQPFCYHDLPESRENRPTLLKRLVQNGMGMVELHATWCQPRYDGPGVSADEARAKLREWRLSAGTGDFAAIRAEFADAGVSICSYYINLGDGFTDPELDVVFEQARALGAKGVVGSWSQATAQRVAPFPGKHGMYLCHHNHDNLSDPEAFASEESLVRGLSYSPDCRVTLDIRHFTAANGDTLGFLQRHHDRVYAVHLGERRRDNGRSTPFGEGDSPLIEVLRMIRDNRWPIIALLEFEHGTLRPAVEEVQIQFDYCKRALS